MGNVVFGVLVTLFAATYALAALGGALAATDPAARLDAVKQLLVALAVAAAAIWWIRTARRVDRERRQRQLAIREQAESEMREVATGKLPVVQPLKVLPKKGEQAHFAAPAQLLKVGTVGYEAGSAGISVRVAKGVSLRTSGMKGHAVKGVIPLATGELGMLDQRVVFAGDMKSFDIPWSRLTHVEEMTDGLIFHDGAASHITRLLVAPERVQLAAAIARQLRST